jgi:UV DNA damage repair endonuclease
MYNYSMTTPKIGFCCKWLDHPDETAGRKPTVESRELNGRSTTMRWLREHKSEAEQRQWDIMNHNARAALLMVERVAQMPEGRRMVRLGSEMLQGYTHEDWIPFWQQQDVQDHCAKIFAPIGARARDLGVRLSFHPGQFCVLASESDEIVERSILEFEYHADMARWMGYGATWHDHGFKINVHLSGKGGVAKFLKTLGRLTPEARNLITIENDEMTNGLDVSLDVAEHVALVLDVHHHWINSGEYINPLDVRTSRVLDSWRGVRPTLHYSVSREDVLVGHDRSVRPDLAQLLDAGFKKQKLRAHSDMMWNTACNEWVLGFADNFDIQCEAKSKNLASQQLYEQYISRNI